MRPTSVELLLFSLGNHAFWLRKGRLSRAAELEKVGDLMILLSCPIPLGQRACGALSMIRRVWVFLLLKIEQTIQIFLHAMTPACHLTLGRAVSHLTR